MAPLRESLVFPEETVYGKRWSDSGIEYRLVKLNRASYERYKKHVATKSDPRLTEVEWRSIVGLIMSPGWEHFFIWPKEPNVLCFRKRCDESCQSASSHTGIGNGDDIKISG